MEHGPHVTWTLLGTNLASKYFGKYSKVKHTFKLHTSPTYKNEEVKNLQGSEHQAQAIVPKCPLSAQCMMCLSVVLQIFLDPTGSLAFTLLVSNQLSNSN